MPVPLEAEQFDTVTRRRQMYKAETRAALLLAAERLFVARGFPNTSIGAITQAAFVSKGTFYNYFADKTAIFADIYTKQVERIGSMTEEACQAIESQRASVPSAAAGLVDRFLRYSAANKEYRAVIVAGPAVLGEQCHQINLDTVLPHLRLLLLMLAGRPGENMTSHIEAGGHVLLSALLESVRVIENSPDVERDIPSYRRALEAMLLAASRFDD